MEPSVTEDVRLRRFLCYGSEGAVYSAREKLRLSLERVSSLSEMIEAGRGREVAQAVAQEARRLIQTGGESKSAGPVLFALAALTQHSDAEAKRVAYAALGEFCASSGELFTFIQYKKDLSAGGQRGMWGRALRRFVADWYNSRDAIRTAREVTRCKRRAGWTHQDLFRLAHYKPASDAAALIGRYVTKGWKAVQETYADKEQPEDVARALAYLEAVEKVKHSSDQQEVAHLIEGHQLEREQLLTKHLKSKEVWRALLKDMPLPTLLTHLAKMSADHVLAPGSPDVLTVCERIKDEQVLLEAKIHPFSITAASETYKRGHGVRGKLKWEPNRDVIQALDSAFWTCLSNVQSTGKRLLVGVDVSARPGSMALGGCISTVAVAASIGVVMTRSEPGAQVLLFSEGAVVPCTISPDSSLIQVATQLMQTGSSCTDCSLPILWASDNDKIVDVFVVLTNNETWTGTSNPAETLRTYRQKAGVFAKLIVCAMATNVVCVADPDDRGMLDVCGFDVHAVNVLHDFIADVI